MFKVNFNLFSVFCSTIISGGIELKEENIYISNNAEAIGVPFLRLANIPEYCYYHVMVQTNGGDILFCGGLSKKCYVLRNNRWVRHSYMKSDRCGAIGIQMANGIYVFGGVASPKTSEFLPNNATIWQKGPDIPLFYCSLVSFAIEPFQNKAHGHAVSNTELIIIKEDHIIKGYCCSVTNIMR